VDAKSHGRRWIPACKVTIRLPVRGLDRRAPRSEPDVGRHRLAEIREQPALAREGNRSCRRRQAGHRRRRGRRDRLEPMAAVSSTRRRRQSTRSVWSRTRSGTATSSSTAASAGAPTSSRRLRWGARAVQVGRPIVWGLVVDGEQGVGDVLSLLRDELDLAMALTGCRSIDEITSDLLSPQ
jgi:FMN-dependent dehydrogenase